MGQPIQHTAWLQSELLHLIGSSLIYIWHDEGLGVD
jgi:hypothetical protein